MNSVFKILSFAYVSLTLILFTHPHLSFTPYNQPFLHLKSSLQTSTLLKLQERSWLHFCKTGFSARKFLSMSMSLWTSVWHLLKNQAMKSLQRTSKWELLRWSRMLLEQLLTWLRTVNLWIFQNCWTSCYWRMFGLLQLQWYQLKNSAYSKTLLSTSISTGILGRYGHDFEDGHSTSWRLPDTGWSFIQGAGLFSQGGFYYFCSP